MSGAEAIVCPDKNGCGEGSDKRAQTGEGMERERNAKVA